MDGPLIKINLECFFGNKNGLTYVEEFRMLVSKSVIVIGHYEKGRTIKQRTLARGNNLFQALFSTTLVFKIPPASFNTPATTFFRFQGLQN